MVYGCNGYTNHRRKRIYVRTKQLVTFVSTKTLKEDYSKPFCFLNGWPPMLGVGVGFDTKGWEIIVKGVDEDR